MLRQLAIRNLAVIDELTLDFAPGFSVLTGETGAGKSILVDALGLLLGDRAEGEREGVEQDRLAGAGFAGQHGKAGGKIDVEPIDQDDVADREPCEHGSDDGGQMTDDG